MAEMLRRDPGTPLTMARVAEAVGAAPMSLYRHFSDKDDLMVAVTRHVMRDAEASVPTEGTWQDRLRSWMTSVYDQAVRHPQLFLLTASGESLAWLSHAAHLTTILESAGFSDEQQLAEAVFWVGTTTLGQAMVAASAGEEMTLPRLYAALGHLSPEEASHVARLVPHFAQLSGPNFDLVVDLTIAALSSRIPGGAR